MIFLNRELSTDGVVISEKTNGKWRLELCRMIKKLGFDIKLIPTARIQI